MAIIYSYPDKSSPSLSDKIIITDVESTPANQTKRCTIQSLADAISGQFTLQEVLQAGSSAIGETGDAWSGNMSLKEDGPFILPRIGRQWTVDMNSLTGSANDKVAYLVGDMQIAGDGDTKTGDLDMSGNLTVATNGNIAGNLNMTGLTSDVILNGGNFTATAGKQTKFQASTGLGGGFSFDTNGNATAGFTAGTFTDKLNSVDFQVEGFFNVNSANTTTGDISLYAGDDMVLRGSDITLQATSGTGHILDLGNYGSSSNRFDEVNIAAEDIIRVRTYSGNSRLELNGSTGSVNYFSALDLQTNELRLNGSAGSAGQLLASGGAGTNPTWINASDLSVENLIEAVENNTGSLIPKGAPVHIAANPSGTPRVEPADAAVPSTMPASGLAYEDIPAGVGQPGEMMIAGQLEGINTVPFGLGSVVYVNTAGGVGTRPVGPANLVQNVGIVTKAAANGILQVTAIGRTNDLPNNDANALFAASSTGTPISTTGKFEVNVSGNSMLIGDTAGATDVTINSNNFRGEVKNDTAAGVENLQIGYQSLEQAMINGGTAQSNVAVGIRSMQGNAGSGVAGGSYNVAVGNDTLNSNASLFNLVTGNTAIGHQALQGGSTNIADYNTAVGYQSLINLAGVTTGTADNNTAVGAFSLFNVTSGGENTSIGVGAGQAIVFGSNNVFVGHQSGTSTTTLTNGTAIGQNADVLNDGGTALGQDTIVQAPGSIALGKGAVAANPNTININVANINGVQPNGGLFVTNAGAPPAGLTPGDVYVLDAAAATNTTGHNLLCIMP